MAAQRTSGEPCLVISPRWTTSSDSRCLGVSPAQLQSFLAESKRLMSPISATKMAAMTLPTPGERHEGPIAGVGLELGVDVRVELGDGRLVDVEEVAQRVEAHGVGLGELETVELGLTGRSPQLADDGQDPVLGHDPVDLGLGTGPVPDERIAIAHQLAQLSDLGRGDPALGQAPEGQHGGQVLGVAHVVLHPAVPPVVAERMGEVHVGAELLEQIGGPVPAIGGFEDHLGLGPGGGHGLGELEGLADEALGAEHLAVFCHPNDGGAATMQVDSDVLSHRGLLLFRGFLLQDRACSDLTRGGGPAPSSHQDGVPPPAPWGLQPEAM